MHKIDTVINDITQDESRRMPQAERQRLARVMRRAANVLDPEPDAPQRVLEAFGALRARDLDGMCPVDRAGFAAACRKWAQAAELRTFFSKGGERCELPGGT